MALPQTASSRPSLLPARPLARQGPRSATGAAARDNLPSRVVRALAASARGPESPPGLRFEIVTLRGFCLQRPVNGHGAVVGAMSHHNARRCGLTTTSRASFARDDAEQPHPSDVAGPLRRPTRIRPWRGSGLRSSCRRFPSAWIALTSRLTSTSGARCGCSPLGCGLQVACTTIWFGQQCRPEPGSVEACAGRVSHNRKSPAPNQQLVTITACVRPVVTSLVRSARGVRRVPAVRHRSFAPVSPRSGC